MSINNNCCNTCPFAFNEDSEYFQNMGCLPSPFDIKKMNEEGYLWGCHSIEIKPCVGQFNELFGTKPNPKNPLVPYHLSSLFGFEWGKILSKNKSDLKREWDFIKNINSLSENVNKDEIFNNMSKFKSGFYGSYFNFHFYLRFIYFFKRTPSLDELFSYYKECISILDKEPNFDFHHRFDEFRFMFSII